jgi:hypothetical protein
MTRLLCLLLACLSLSAQASTSHFTASVDRTRLTAGESLELILESNDATLFAKPDLQPLNELFDVLASRQVNRLGTVNGQAQTSTRWIITLQPRQTGYVIIPPLTLGDLQSAPITLHVQDAGSQGNGQLAPVFIDASLDQDSVYVQAQSILTLRIYHSVSLYDDSSLTPLEITDARVEPLGDAKTYEKLLNGIRHGVIELRYAIYPQQSGELSIPGQVFTATLAERAGSQDFNPFGPRQGRVTRIRSPQLSLQVKTKPAEYPADAPWLPARNLSLVEAWSPEPGKARVADSLTRSLLLKVDGLSSAQLPPLPPTQAPGLRRYPDQPQLANQASEQGLIGSREEREALVASLEGPVELPPIEIHWWNTLEDRLELATLPGKTLQIANNPDLETPPIDSITAAPAAVLQGPPLWPWQLSTLILALSTLWGFILWWQARQQPPIQRVVASGPSPRDLLDVLKRSCLANDTQATRHALDDWARQQPETLADMAARYLPLSAALDGLNGALYSESGQYWQGRELWLAIRSLPPLEAPDDSGNPETSPLPPLYPR